MFLHSFCDLVCLCVIILVDKQRPIDLSLAYQYKPERDSRKCGYRIYLAYDEKCSELG